MASESVSRADWVADELRRAILARDFEPGERLSAERLAERFKVSQTPLREAFARLAGEGWVAYLPQRGVRVADVSVEEMLEIYELRELLEPLAIGRSVAHGDGAWRDGVRACFDEMVELAGPEPAALDGRAYDAYEQAHTRFHSVLVQQCQSQWLTRLTTRLRDQSTRFRRLSLPLRGRLGSVHDEHAHICAAAQAGDAAAAAAAALLHFQNTKSAILEWHSERTAETLTG